jgi:hypothetical protein
MALFHICSSEHFSLIFLSRFLLICLNKKLKTEILKR